MNKTRTGSSRKTMERVTWLVLIVFALLIHALQSTMGSAYYSLMEHDYLAINPPPVVLQSGTAGSSTIYTNGTSALSRAVASAPTPTYYPNGYNMLSGNWWSSNHAFRRKVTINNNVASILSAGYSVLLALDTSSLVTSGKMLSSGNDLRILYWNGSSSSWSELDRVVQNMNTASTTVRFKTQASIGATGSDDNYYVYYGFSSAGNPPTNPGGVYLFYDDFSEGTLKASKWTVISGTPTIESGELNLADSVELRTVPAFDRGYVWEQDVKTQADGSQARIHIVYTDTTNNYHVHLDTNGLRLHNGLDAQLGASVAYVRPTNHLLRITVTPNTLRAQLINNVDSSVLWDSGTVTDTAQTGTKPVGYRHTYATGTIHFHHDNLKIRSYVSPEPTVSLSSEESSYHISGSVPTSVQTVDPDYLVTKSVASNTTTSPYYPSNYYLNGSTALVSGSVSNLPLDDGAYMTFKSYENTSCTLQYYNSSDDPSSTISGTYSDKVILTFNPSLAGNYLIIASAGLSGTSIAYDVQVRMDIDGTTYANPTWQPDEANMWESFMTSKVINFDTGSHTIRIQYSSENTAQTVTIRRARIVVLGLSDYVSSETEAQQTVNSGTYTDIVTSTVTPSAAGVYLIVATAEVEAASITNYIYTRLQIDSEAKDEMITTGATTTDYEVFAAHNVTTLSTASHTIRIQASRTGFANRYIRRARITVIRLSDCYDYQTGGSEEVSSTTSTAWQNKAVLTFTPTVGENYLIMATAKIKLSVATNGYQSAVNFTLDDTEYGYWQAGLSGGTDYLTFAVMMNVSLSAASHTLKIAYRTTDATYTASIKDARIVAVRQARQYISEVEFTGSTNTESWTKLEKSMDLAWTIGSVAVTVQIYNYTQGGYPASGNGYDSYTSSSTANTDETRNQTITTNATSFRDASGNWKIKVKGIKSTTTQFDFKADWVEFKTTHNSEFTVSTEFLFSGMTTNAPTQLNFTVVSEYNLASVNATIQVWNYSSSAYVTSGEGYSAYTSTGTNLTANLNIGISPQPYVSYGNAKIKITGVATTTSQYQQQVNQVKVDYIYTASPDYNYLLGMNENHGTNWKIRLRAYNQSNIGRLSNCSIYIYNGSNSTQIIISSGAYTQQTGQWCDLTASDFEYIGMHVEASSADTSYIYLCLEILVPNITTYSQYILTFVIT